MIITIDGPVATGKSTIAKKLAERLGFIYYDTGAMYRCITYALLSNSIDLDNEQQVEKVLETFSYEVGMVMGEKKYYVDHKDVTEQIRQEAVTALVSKVSAIGAVRNKLVSLQRSLAEGVNAVFEGRDMGTVVFPDAHLKIFLTGQAHVRAKRRYDEFKVKFPQDSEKLTLEMVIADINRRDEYDSNREISPLKQAPDAHVIDTSNLTLDEIVEKILFLHESLIS